LLSLMTSIVLSLFAFCSGRCSSRVGPSLVGFIVDDKILEVLLSKLRRREVDSGRVGTTTDDDGGVRRARGRAGAHTLVGLE